MYLFFDTETTGKADYQAPYTDERQPYLAQLGAILADSEGDVRGELNVIIRPDGWKMPDETSAIHGLTDEILNRFGVPLYTALGLFKALATRANMVVAHNMDFDDLILSVASYRNRSADAERLYNCQKFCTMKASTDICKLPGKYGKYKWPKLQEAHKHFFGVEFVEAHDAMADVKACKRVFFEMKRVKESTIGKG